MPARAHLESDIPAWEQVAMFARQVAATVPSLRRAAGVVERLAQRNRAKDVRALRTNPNLVQVLANPTHGIGQRKKPADVISYDVQAVAYRHHDDDRFYVHVFGPESDRRKKKAEGLIGRDPFLDALPEETGIMMIREGNHVVLRSQNANTPIVKMF